MDKQIRPQIPVRRGVELCKFLAMLTLPFAASLFLRLAPDGAERFYPRCVWNAATGLYCPGCGTQRALAALGHLDFRAAFMYNPFLFLLIAPAALYMGAVFLFRAVTGRRAPSILSSYKAALPAAVIIIAIWVARNLFRF